MSVFLLRLSRPCLAQQVNSKPFLLVRHSSQKQLDFREIDKKWQPLWNNPQNHVQQTGDKKEKYYILPMFPYPSGSLHLGHLRNYTIPDVLARYRRMMNYDVLHAIGWDAFGLPAENAAIERGIDPAQWTSNNIAAMRDQIKSMGGLWDWDKELMTCDPQFYEKTQRLFLHLYRRNLAYQAEELVNYDPVDKTVLANEQIDSNGFSWRSGAKAEKISLKQWFFRITAYQEELLDDLQYLEKTNAWPQRVISMQRNWLGKSNGASISFDLQHKVKGLDQSKVQVFTTRPDTLFGVQFIALSLRHPIVKAIAETSPDVQAFVDAAETVDTDSKTGYLLPRVEAFNPARKLVDPESEVYSALPVFVAPYVLDDYGSGAVMGVPGHDSRDFAFWKENMPSRPIRTVIERQDNIKERSMMDGEPVEAFSEYGILTNTCGPYSGMRSADASKALVDDLQRHLQSSAHVVRWRLRDWLISRQRYWGTPIPIIHCDDCGAVPVPDQDLPVVLPTLSGNELKTTGNPLEHVKDWVSVTCPKCQAPARRETDTMDTFVDSSWYYMEFAEKKRNASELPPEKSFMPVDVYIGGVEHAILHLLYARFISKVLTAASTWPVGKAKGEPFAQLITQGMVHGRTYSDPDTGRFVGLQEVDVADPQNIIIRGSGKPARISWEKMSKSKYNGVDPTGCIRKYGADATRAHILFQAPISEILDWDEDKISGIHRWFRRTWQIVQELSVDASVSSASRLKADAAAMNDAEATLWSAVQSTIESTNLSLSKTYSLNTVISDLMQLSNILHQSLRGKTVETSSTGSYTLHQSCRTLLLLLSPVAPSFVEECWSTLYQNRDQGYAYQQPFPQPDGSLEILQARSMPCAVQVNGKLKFATKIAKPPEELQGEDLKRWVLRRMFESNAASDATQKGTWKKEWDINTAKKIVVARGGRTVNFVF